MAESDKTKIAKMLTDRIERIMKVIIWKQSDINLKENKSKCFDHMGLTANKSNNFQQQS